jgi:hypothetical protein
MKRLILASTLLAVCSVVAASCKDNAPHCDPQEVRPCFCAMGTNGQMVCADDGQNFGACVCLDGGVPDAEPAGTEPPGAAPDGG